MLIEMISLSYPIKNAALVKPPTKQVLAIGDFDGVHLGHREVIGRATYTAEQLKLPASIMTFDPHPREVLGYNKYKDLLTPIHRRMELFEQLGVSYMYAVKFDEALMKLTPQQFVDEVLLPLDLDSVIVGFDFTFGFQGKGDPDTLCELSHGKFAVEVVRPYHIDGAKVSSTSVRESLSGRRYRRGNPSARAQIQHPRQSRYGRSKGPHHRFSNSEH